MWNSEYKYVCIRETKIVTFQAAIHYHLPYSSLYGRINRLKREQAADWSQFRDMEEPDIEDNESSNGGIEYK